MTIVLAARCLDGLVIASDTQITESDRGVSYPAQKLHPLGERAAWGGSGSRAVLMELAGKYDDNSAAILEAPNVADALQEQTLPVLRHHYENFIADVPGEKEQGTPSAYVLAAGYKDESPWIIAINPNGMVAHYEDIGFHAIGSGAAMAQQAGSLMAHFRMVEREIDYGLTAAVRVLESLSLTSPSVGGPLNVTRITPEKGAQPLDEDEIEEYRGHVRRWEELEQKALDKLFS
jgi:proteasome beta subunit